MKKCVYPLIVYADRTDNCYVGIFPDLDVVSSGATVEETYLSALDSLKVYLEFASKMDYELSNATTYEEAVIMNPKRIVLLGGVEIDVDKFELSQADQNYKNFVKNLLEDKED